MQFATSAIVACLCAYSALAQITESVTTTGTITSVVTSSVVESSSVIVTSDVTATTVITGTNVEETFTTGVTTFVTASTVVTSSDIVTATGGATESITLPMVTNTVTETATTFANTVFETVTGTATQTVTSFSGTTTVNSCIPTTTIIVTTTTTAPVPTSPASVTVSFVRSDCSSAVCPAGRRNIMKNGVAKRCVLTLSGSTLISTTCVPDFCCTSFGSSPVIRSTNCNAVNVKCPAHTSLLVNSHGEFVPCLQYFRHSKMVDSTCTSNTCCSAAGSGSGSGASMSCRNAIKCKVYNKDPTTNYIKKCSGTGCTRAFCCRRN